MRSESKLNPGQTFVMTKVCYQALPMSAFTTLQKRVFPVYFRLQSLLFLSTALTHPPFGPVSLVSSPWDLMPLGIGGALAVLNMMVWGPRTQEAMVERIHQGEAWVAAETRSCGSSTLMLMLGFQRLGMGRSSTIQSQVEQCE